MYRPSISYAVLSTPPTMVCFCVSLLVVCFPSLDTVARFSRILPSSSFSCNFLAVFPFRRPYTFSSVCWRTLRADACCAQLDSPPYCWHDSTRAPADDRMLSTPLLRSMDNISAAQTHRQTPSHMLRISLYFLQGLCSSLSSCFLLPYLYTVSFLPRGT